MGLISEPAVLGTLWIGAWPRQMPPPHPHPACGIGSAASFKKKLKEKKKNRSRRSWGKKYIRKNIIRTKRWLQERERAGGGEGGAGGRAARALVAAKAGRRPLR